ncbi:hypothetical protein [Pyrodictium abyssi]|uniref:Uncharacterized protein n=1 Tax=Pyrodictium abyssi TaxID=54256 RepID=A0ABM8IU87_9CREN|nr:hypothetical protein PABY_06880 [Pyrodictium abyssi]
MVMLPPVAGVMASAAALALLAGFAAVLTGTPGVFYALGLAGAREEPVHFEVVKPLAIGAASDAQGMVSVNPWFKVKLENAEELKQYFRYLILIIREAAEFEGKGTYTSEKVWGVP